MKLDPGKPELPDCLHHGEDLLHPGLLMLAKGTFLHPLLMNDLWELLSPAPSLKLHSAQLLYMADVCDSVTVHFILQSLRVVEVLQLCHRSLRSRDWSHNISP